MRTSAAALLASAGLANALQQCTGSAKEEGGNWFCGAVKHILYSNVGHPGTYKEVAHMGEDGSCNFVDKPFSGPLAPFNEELAYLVRGPIDFKQFAVYTLGAKGKRSEEVSHTHARRHGHSHLHDELEKRQGDKGKFTKSQKAKPVPVVGEYGRVGYYNAQDQTADGIVFLGNYGGQGSGVFDYKWGNSLSYLNADGNGGAASPQILKQKTIPSNNEFAIYSDQKCNGDCGFSRPGAVAYHGFGGADKVFLAEVKMPYDGNRGFNGDMPALWTLNGKIPRTAQYSACSCWESDCGEFDILEVLASGDSKCKSTFHTNVPGGSSDYFERPVDKFIKVATIFDSASASVSVKILPDNTPFGTSLTKDQVQSWIKTDGDKTPFSLFALGG